MGNESIVTIYTVGILSKLKNELTMEIANSSLTTTAVERMRPSDADIQTFWEHIERYAFATQFVKGKEVLDIACGEGYGTAALLKAGAKNVIGIDISETACQNAIKNYGVDARIGSAMAIPLDDNSIDIVVSFETIEHVDSPSTFLDECQRVLRFGGLLVMSTPNAEEDKGPSANPFHPSEMSEEKFTSLLRERFSIEKVCSQSIQTNERWSLRSISALNSTWKEVRGYWKLRSLLCPHLIDSKQEYYKHQPVECILTKRSLSSRIFNPYCVRSHTKYATERALYTVAVAKKI